jgi:hypothetical protein
MNLDRSFFTVFCRNLVTERTLADICSREETIDDILHGQINDVVGVMESNPHEGWAKDVSEDFAREIASRLEPAFPVPRDLRDFIEAHAPEALPVHAFEPAREYA